jgi:alkyl hydroperoxide reductase subunit F
MPASGGEDMLDAALKTQLQGYFARIVAPITLAASLDDGAKSAELAELCEEIASLSDKISYVRSDDDARRPSFAILRDGGDVSLRFAAVPGGHEFNSFVLALLHVGGHAPKETEETLTRIRALDGDYRFETYVSLSCQSCPEVVQALDLMAALNPRVRHVVIDGALFPQETEERQIMAVPAVFLNGAPFQHGRATLEELLDKLDAGAGEKRAAALSAKEPFDVLVVGGGPAGAAAAIYAARKGVRTGLVAERFGGQVQDTAGIENFISVPHTEGPQMAAALERHVAEYSVDVMSGQRAAALVPATEAGGLAELRLANGATLRSKTVVLAPGARWRRIDVPGETEYMTKGVAYCPHCDGPLFRGKRVAVIGGGNSGVEAAIDLAGLASHVTLLEFDSRLRADGILQGKLRSLPNVTILVSAQTTQILGDGAKVTGLVYRDRESGAEREIALDGVFVQIGLLPSTDWLEGAVALTRYKEIEIDRRCRTSAPGIFAAGDATTVPYKQIVVAMGEGATAALAAFDHLVRM